MCTVMHRKALLGDSIFLVKGKKMSGEGTHGSANKAIAGMEL